LNTISFSVSASFPSIPDQSPGIATLKSPSRTACITRSSSRSISSRAPAAGSGMVSAIGAPDSSCSGRVAVADLESTTLRRVAIAILRSHRAAHVQRRFWFITTRIGGDMLSRAGRHDFADFHPIRP